MREREREQRNEFPDMDCKEGFFTTYIKRFSVNPHKRERERERKSERERENLYFTPKPPEERKMFLKKCSQIFIVCYIALPSFPYAHNQMTGGCV